MKRVMIMTDRDGKLPVDGQLLSVGKPLPNWTAPMPEGAQLFMDYGGSPFLMFFYNDIAPHEPEALSEGEIRFGLYPAGDHTFFLLHSIEGFTQGWADAPYALGVLSPENRPKHDRDPTTGYLFSFILAESTTGIIRAMRAATVTPRFSQRLDDALKRLENNLPDFSREKHDAEIQAAYRRFPRPYDMAKGAVVKEVLGRKFPKHAV